MNKYNLIIFLAFLVIGCSDSSNPIAPAREDFRYPLQPGTTWHYSRTVISKFNNNKPPDSTAYSVLVKVIGPETIYDSLNTIKVKESVDGPSTLVNYHYYQHSGDALYLVASLGSGLVLPKTAAALPIYHSAHFLHSSFAHTYSSESDSIFRHLPPKAVLHYPLSEAREWRYSETGKPRRANKRVVGETEVSTPAGTFDVVQIQWRLDFDGDGSFDDNVEYFDYIAEQGLVKRSFVVRNLPLVDDKGNFIGSYDFIDTSVLTTQTP